MEVDLMDKVFCYVGDVTGYKNILLSLSIEEQQKRIDEFRKLIQNAAESYGFNESYIITSDTIFVIAENNKAALEKLIKFSRHLLEKGIYKSLPIRGAIDFGFAQIDKDKNLIYGEAAVNAYELAEEQDWIGTCCAENSNDCCKVPKLPYINELWSFDLVFVYPVPMKSGKILFRPVVSWDVPEYDDFRALTVGGGLVSDKYMDWKYANRVQNTIVFSQYLKAILAGRLQAKPDKFPADLPIKHIDDMVKEYLAEIRFLSGGWSIVKIPGKNKICLRASDIKELSSILQNIAKDDEHFVI